MLIIRRPSAFQSHHNGLLVMYISVYPLKASQAANQPISSGL